MDEKTSEFLLKVLSGNHQGAEVVFGYETAVIGSESSSDVILSDSLIEPKHLEITFSADGIVLKPLNSKVFVDGKLIEEETKKIEFFQFITIGTTHIIIGPASQVWPAISAADAPQIGRTDNSQMQMEDVVIDDKISAPSGKIKKLKRSKTLVYGAGVLVILGIAISLLIFISLFSDPKPVAIKPDTMQLLENAIQELGLANEVSIARTENGFLASGYTVSTADLVELQNKLLLIDPSIKRKMYSEEKILSEINALLASVESRPKVQSISDGIFLITGYAFDKDKWAKIRKRILEDVRGIIDLQDEVILPQKAMNLIRPILIKYKLLGKIAVIPQPQDLVLQGLVSGDEEENWKLAKVNIEKTLGTGVAIRNFVKISDPEVIKKQYFGSEVNSVSISENGLNWIGFKDGTKYMVGATLSNGYSIKAITPDNVILTKDNQNIVLKIGELK